MQKTSRFFCCKCGREGISIPRKSNHLRKSGHLKKLWCIYCREEVNHVEIKEFQSYTVKDFEDDFKKDVFKEFIKY